MMRSHTLRRMALGLSTCALAIPSFAFAQGGPPPTFFVRRDTIIPVVIENDLSIRDAREGDRFTAHVENDRDLPFHTRLIGRVLRMHLSRRGAVADMEFTDVILPDGSRHRIDALPCSLDDRYVRHLDDGRIVVRENSGAGDVFGGAVGGFIVGSAFRRPILGTFVGAIVGSIAAHNDREGERLLSKGERIGALFTRDADLERYPDRPRADRGFDRVYGLNDSRPSPPALRDPNIPPPLPPTSVPAVPPTDRRGMAVNYEGRDLQFDSGAMPYREGNVFMVPLQRTATQLGLTVERGRDNVIYIEGEDSSVRLEQDSTDARLNGHKVSLSSPVVDRNGVLYVPVDILASMKKGNLSVNGERIKVQLGE